MTAPRGTPAAARSRVRAAVATACALAVLGATACVQSSGPALFLQAAAALAGAYALARRLGLAALAAAIAAASFAGSGALLAAADPGPDQVAWTLPWILLGLELCRGARRAPGVVLAAGALLVAVRAGDGAAAAVACVVAAAWAASLHGRDARAGRAALLALVAGAAAGVPRAWSWARAAALAGDAPIAAEPDWLALGLAVLALAVAVRFVGRSARDERAFEPLRAVAAACALLLLAGLLARRGASGAARMLFFPDVFGGPGHGVWRGAGDWLADARAWVPFAALALALAAMLSPARAGASRLPSRGVALALALIGLLLALRLPGPFDLLARLPDGGASAAAAAGACSALFLGLFAGEGFASSTRTARAAAAVVLAGLAGLALLEPADARAPGVADPSDELVAFTERPPAEVESGALPLAGWIDPGLDVHAARLSAQRLAIDGAPRGRALELPVELADAPWEAPPAGARAPAADARFFRVAGLRASELAPGTWRFTLELRASDGRVIGARVAGFAHLVRRPRPSRLSLFFAAAGLLALLVLPRGAGGAALVLVLVVGQALDVRRAAPAEPVQPLSAAR